jgi:uncharacterized membrane protein YeaQ/YmgE (transglycosylase-associated protein family)
MPSGRRCFVGVNCYTGLSGFPSTRFINSTKHKQGGAYDHLRPTGNLQPLQVRDKATGTKKSNGVPDFPPAPYRDQTKSKGTGIMSILWTIIIGFVAGVIAKFIMPGPNEPSGFILTTILGIVGAFVATYLGQALHWYGPGQGAGLIGAVVGAVIVLLVYGMITGRRTAV